MTGPDRDVYHRCFNRRPEGHAIYHAETSGNLRPGACGYFDDGGEWNTIVYTLDPSELEEKKLGKLEGVRLPHEEVETTWTGPMVSSSMKRINADVGLRGGDEKVAVSVTVGYESSTGEGAVLLAKGNVVRNTAMPKHKLSDWVEENLEKLAQIRGVSEQGLWIITKTYTANQRALATVSSKNSKVTWSVKVQVAETNQLGPSAEWWGSQKDSFWKEDKSPQGIVLFVSGFKWEPSKMLWKRGRLEFKKPSRQKTLDGDNNLEEIQCLYEDADEEKKLFLLTFRPEVIGS